MSFKSTIGAVALLLPLLSPAAEISGVYGADVTLEAYAALNGGADQGTGLHGLALLHSEYKPADDKPDQLTWSGYVSALALSGRGPTERYVGDLQGASNMEGFASIRLYSWWLEAHQGDWSLRGGALLADDEFTGTDAGGNFCNSSFGWPVFISANTVNAGPAFYVAAPGLRLDRTWGDRGVWRFGVYDGDAFDSPAGDPHPTRHGLHYQIGGDQGWFLITEGTIALTGAATRLTAGAWLHTADFADVRDDANGQPFALSGLDPRNHGSNHGAYASIQHTLAGETGKAGNTEIYVRGGFSPGDRNAIDWALDTGVAWTGLLPGRPDDVTAVGLAHAHHSPRYAAAARLADPASPTPDYEQVLEVSYTLSLSEKLNLQPDFQYIRHPGGSTAQKDACIFLLRVNASY